MSKKEITIKSVDREDDYGIIVEFSDGTTAGTSWKNCLRCVHIAKKPSKSR